MTCWNFPLHLASKSLSKPARLPVVTKPTLGSNLTYCVGKAGQERRCGREGERRGERGGEGRREERKVEKRGQEGKRSGERRGEETREVIGNEGQKTLILLALVVHCWARE